MSKQRSRVLVVDDEEGILRAVGRALVINGYDVETAADGTTVDPLFDGASPGRWIELAHHVEDKGTPDDSRPDPHARRH